MSLHFKFANKILLLLLLLNIMLKNILKTLEAETLKNVFQYGFKRTFSLGLKIRRSYTKECFLLSTQGIITVLAWHQNPHLLFQKLERIMENLISDVLVQKSGTRLKSS